MAAGRFAAEGRFLQFPGGQGMMVGRLPSTTLQELAAIVA